MNLHLRYLSVIAIMGIVIFILLQLWNAERQHSGQKDSVIAEKNSEIVYHKNLEGSLIAEKNAAVASLNTIKESYPKLLQEAVNRLNVKAKDIATVSQVGFVSSGNGQVKIVHDTIKGMVEVPVADINDGYLKLHGELVEDVYDYVKYNYTYTDSLIQSFERKKKLFKPDLFIIKSSLSNPNAKITAETGLMVQEVKQKRFNISVGVGYNPFQNQFYPTISAGYAMIQF